MEKALTFIVRAMKDRNKILRCLASISRQSNDNFNVIVLCSLDSVMDEINDIYPSYEVVKLNKSGDFIKSLKKVIGKVESTYCVFVDYDEIVTTNAVDLTSSEQSDMLIFNISRQKKNKFAALYPTNKDKSIAEAIKSGVFIWNNAIKTDVLKDSIDQLTSLDYNSQLIFLLDCYSKASKSNFSNVVIAYKEDVENSKKITYPEFRKSEKQISLILKRLKRRKMNDIRVQIVNKFIVPQIEVIYNEKSIIKKVYKKYLIIKYIGL